MSPERGSEFQGHTAAAGPCSGQEWATDLPFGFRIWEESLGVF